MARLSPPRPAAKRAFPRTPDVRMVDIAGKAVVRRSATAEGTLRLLPRSLDAVRHGTVPKGDVLTTSKIAAIQAVKRTPEMLPLCHPIPLTSVEVAFDLREHALVCRCTVGADYRTGVEMEALTGVVAALLTAWDMVKGLEKDADGQYPGTRIEGVRVVEKRKTGVAG